MEFKPGDVVVLKSGGPDMTISSIDEGQKASCYWFNGVDGPHYKQLALVVLKKVA